MTSRNRRFPISNRLTKPAEFRKVFGTKNRSGDTLFVVMAISSGLQRARLGLAISKKHLLLAVNRNRVKRLVRESFRHHQELLKGLDIIVIARKRTLSTDNSRLTESLSGHWHRIRQCNT